MALNLGNGLIRDDVVADLKEPEIIDLTNEEEDDEDAPEAEAKPFDFIAKKRRCWGCCPGCVPECAPGACHNFQPNQEAHYEGCMAE
jgi:hypothetical protein